MSELLPTNNHANLDLRIIFRLEIQKTGYKNAKK